MSKKPSLFNASAALSNLMEIIDSEDMAHSKLISEFKSTQTEICEAIDRRKYVVAECDSRIETAKKMIKDIKEHVARLNKTKEQIKKSTVESMRLNPQYKYTDSLGRQIKVRKSVGSAVFNFDTMDVCLSNCIEYHKAIDPAIAPYVDTKTYYCINRAKVNNAIKSGENLQWVRFEKKDIVTGL